jgi:hypothetical protein
MFVGLLVWKPNWSGIVYDRFNKGFVGKQECFLVMAQGCATDRTHEI